MYPVICEIGPLTVYSYGVMMAVAVIVCTILATRDAKKAGIKPDLVFDLVFWVVLGGIVGARLFFIFLNLEYFIENPQNILKIHNGGLAFQGGLIFATIVGVTFVKIKGLKLTVMMDFAAPYIALGQSIGRVGCLLNGCCYGIAHPHGIFFPVHGEHLHPTQLYSTLGLLAIFFVLRRFQQTNKTPGRVFVLYLILAAGLRFLVEFLRADHQTLALGLSVFQYVCLGLIVVAGLINLRLKKN